MTVAVTARTVEPVPTAVVAAAATWAEFPRMWPPMLDQVWGFLRGDAPAGLYQGGHNVMLYRDDIPNVEVGVQVTGPFPPAGEASSAAGGRRPEAAGSAQAARAPRISSRSRMPSLRPR